MHFTGVGKFWPTAAEVLSLPFVLSPLFLGRWQCFSLTFSAVLSSSAYEVAVQPSRVSVQSLCISVLEFLLGSFPNLSSSFLSLKIISIFLPEFLILFCFLSLSAVLGVLADAPTRVPWARYLGFQLLIRKCVGLVFFKLVLVGFAGLPEPVNWCLIRRGAVPGTIYSNVFPGPGSPRWERSLDLSFSVRRCLSLCAADGLFL